jgi:hypothetical protein
VLVVAILARESCLRPPRWSTTRDVRKRGKRKERSDGVVEYAGRLEQLRGGAATAADVVEEEGRAETT